MDGGVRWTSDANSYVRTSDGTSLGAYAQATAADYRRGSRTEVSVTTRERESFAEKIASRLRFWRRSSKSVIAAGNGAGADAMRPVSAPPAQRRIYMCDLCGITSKSRVQVFEHLRSLHPSVLDRNGHIHEDFEQTAGAQSGG